MSKSTGKHYIASLDIGTTKVAYLIGEVGAEGLHVIGVGEAPNIGVKQGQVINIDSTTDAIKKAKEEAELMAGIQTNQIWLGISGSHIQSFDSNGMIAIRNKEVTKEDVDRVIETAKAVAIPSDRQVLHVLPNEYKVDNQQGIHDPVGMSGVRLEASVHIITGSSSSIQNSVKCVENAGLKVKGLVLQQFASALSILSDDEKQLGVAAVDIGGGTCDVIAFINKSVVATSVIPVGGQNFTHDIAMGLRTTQNNAEDLKKKHGCALTELVSADETIEVEGVGGRKQRTISRIDLCEIIEARAEETLSLIKQEVEKLGLNKKLGSGIVITGGVSQLTGLIEMGDFALDLPVRRGLPDKIGGLSDVVKSSQYATAVGLLLYGLKQEKTRGAELVSRSRSLNQTSHNWVQKIKNFFLETF